MKYYKYKITVVVPIYNVEQYLAETLDSVIAQTIGFEENIEMILVNDGSPDDSEKICESYQRRYPHNIRYLTKKNGGLSSARNFAFDHIQGKYVNFLDADDKWEKTAFQKAYDFFENHYEEFDILASRVRFFDAKDTWHVLDYKYNKGSRVVDVTNENEQNCVQVHATSVFMKSEAIKFLRFDERVRFGEDGLFVNALILEKLKYGLLDDCIYYYRKRSDKSSLTQIQSRNREYYGESPRLYYGGLIEKSVSRFGYVIPYIQNVLAYDIGWRVRSSAPDEIRSDCSFFADYLNYLNGILGYVEDEVFLRSKVHKRISVKSAFYKLKHPERELVASTRFDLNKKSVYAGNVRLYNFNKDNHSACVISECAVADGIISIEGLVSPWLLSSCPESVISFAVKVNENIHFPEITDCANEKDTTIFGDVFTYDTFRLSIPLDDKINKYFIKAALIVNDSVCEITVRYKDNLSSTAEADCVPEYNSNGIIISND